MSQFCKYPETSHPVTFNGLKPACGFKLILSVIIFINIACKKNDTTPPTITVIGASTVYMALDREYVDPGITATDDKSDVIIDSITNLDTDNMGSYYYRYVA